MKRTNVFLLLLVAIGFILRVSFILVSRDYVNPVAYESGLIAENIVAGKGFAFQSWLAKEVEPTAWIPPFYPFFLAFFFKYFGPYKYLAVQLVQGLVLACLVYPAYGLGNLFHNRKTGLLAAIFVTIYPPFIYYTRVIIYDGFFTFGVTTSLYALVLLSRSPSYPKAAFAGVLLGLSNLISPVLQPFSLLAVFWVYQVLKGTRKRWTYPLIVFAVCLTTVMPWVVRNYIVFHRFVPIRTSFGYNLWLGNRPGFPGAIDPTRSYKGIKFRRITEEERQLLQEMDDATRDHYLSRVAVRYILNDPLAFLKRTLYRVYAYWWISEKFPRGEPLKEGAIQEASSLVGLRKLNLALLYLFGVLGFILSIKKWKMHILFFLLFLTFTAVYGITQSSLSRNRLPAEPPLLIYAAFAIAWGWERIKSKQGYDTLGRKECR